MPVSANDACQIGKPGLEAAVVDDGGYVEEHSEPSNTHSGAVPRENAVQAETSARARA